MSSNKSGSWIRTVAFILVIVLVFSVIGGVICIGYTSSWFGSVYEEQQAELLTEDECNTVITKSESSGISLYSSKISADEYLDYALDYGIHINTDYGGYLLMATITPSYVSDSTVDWAITFVSSGKDASNYVSVTPLTDGGLTAVVVRSSTKSLTEQAVITVSLRSDSSIYAECTVDTVTRYSYKSLYLNYFASSSGRTTAAFSSSISIPYISGGHTIKVTSLVASSSAGSISTDVDVRLYLTVFNLTPITEYLGFEVYYEPVLMYSLGTGSAGYVSYWDDVLTDKNGNKLSDDADVSSLVLKAIKANFGTALFAIQFSVSYADFPEYDYDTYIPIYITES